MASKTPVLDGPDDFKLYYHTNDEGHVWLNTKNSPILLTEPLLLDTLTQKILRNYGTLKLHGKVFSPQ